MRVTALNVDRPPLDHLYAAVLLSPPRGLRGLTPLDLRLLGLLVEGATQVRSLAAVLGVDERTAAEAVHALPAALGATDLTAAVVRALRIGLRIPPQLAAPS